MSHITKMAGASALALFAAVGFAGAASAQQTVRGQGATLPAGLYADWFNPTIRDGVEYSYNAPLVRSGGGTIAARTGSGAGKSAFENHLFNNGFQADGTTPLPGDVTTAQREDIQFAGSDAILTTGDLDTYNAARWGDPIQVPSVGTPVTLAFNKTGMDIRRNGPTGRVAADGSQSEGKVLYLSRASYCGIFTGGITNWNDPRIVADNVRAPRSGPIRVVVRSDGSGTTEIFSRHLDTVCDGSAEAGNFTFPATNTAQPNRPTGRTLIDWVGAGIPAGNLIAAAGSGGVATAIAANPGAIGYVSPDYTDMVATPAPGTPETPPSTANLQNQADINAGRNNNYKHSATWVNVQTAQKDIDAPALTDSAITWGEKLALDDANANNPTGKFAYPIVGFTFLDFYTCYPKNRDVAVRSFANYLIGGGNADAEAKRAGFTPLSRPMKDAVRARLTSKTGGVRGITRGPVSGYCTL